MPEASVSEGSEWLVRDQAEESYRTWRRIWIFFFKEHRGKHGSSSTLEVL